MFFFPDFDHAWLIDQQWRISRSAYDAPSMTLMTYTWIIDINSCSYWFELLPDGKRLYYDSARPQLIDVVAS